MKYIDADKIKVEIDRIVERLKKSCNNDPFVTIGECLTAPQIVTLAQLKDTIDKMKQEAPTPPGIEEESQKEGWLDYGLMMGEIGLHRYNAISRIKEHKGKFNPQDIPDFYHVAEYYESVGMEKVCCCLQAYSKDFIFTQDEVKNLLNMDKLQQVKDF